MESCECKYSTVIYFGIQFGKLQFDIEINSFQMQKI